MNMKSVTLVFGLLAFATPLLPTRDDEFAPAGAGSADPLGWVTHTVSLPIGDVDDVHVQTVIQVSEPVVRSSDGVAARVVTVQASFRVQQVVVSERAIATSMALDDGSAITFEHEAPDPTLAAYFAAALLDPDAPFTALRNDPGRVEVTIEPTATWGAVGSSQDLSVDVVEH